MSTLIKDLKVGDYFRLKDSDVNTEVVSESSVWVRGKYDRFSKRYSCVKFTDSNHERFFKGDKIVFTDFYF